MVGTDGEGGCRGGGGGRGALRGGGLDDMVMEDRQQELNQGEEEEGRTPSQSFR